MDLEQEAKKEIGRIDNIMKNLTLVDSKGESLFKVLKSYYEDAKSFFKQEKHLQALEASFICWAYIDAGLHLGVFKVPEEMKNIFTI